MCDSNWSPLIINDVKKEVILSKLHEIANELKPLSKNSLLNGNAGLSLFYAYYYKLTNQKDYLVKTNNYLENALMAIVESKMIHTFCSGFTGISWTFNHLRNEGLIEEDIDLRDIEEYIISFSKYDLENKNYDFMHGGLGAGLYYLDQLGTDDFEAKKNLEIIVKLLYQSAEKDNDDMKWFCFNRKGEKEYNLGISHGIPGIIYFLNKCLEHNILPDLCKSMLGKAVQFMLKQRLPLHELSFFPTSTNNKSGSRLAWCYGDLGIATTLLTSAKNLKDHTLEEFAMDMLFHSIKRKNLKENRVMDGGICHGASGVFHIYNRIYQLTSIKEFKETAIYWLDKTLEMSHHKNGIAGYKFWHHSQQWKNNSTVLEGTAGIGLTLISAISDIEPQWDRCLLLS